MLHKEGYSFSTMWNLRKHTRGEDIINEILDLGFEQVELNYNVTAELLSTIEPMIESGRVRISSVHNVFPFIPDKNYDTDSVMLGFDDLEKRRRAVELLTGSVDYAVRYGAKGVVVHPGEVPFDYNIDAELKRLWREHGRNSPEYAALWDLMLEQRNALAPIHVRRIQESLEIVSEYIAKKGHDVKIGIETRSRCNQIPTLQEAGQIIEGLQGAPVYLWYDIGHGMLMDRMGLYDNVKEILELKHKVLGIHIHETVDLVDHWCPYIQSGGDDGFDAFLDVIEAAPIKVYELRSPNTAEQIEQSFQIMTGKMAARKGTGAQWNAG
ncbi:sugar phosphate isomerase/epimerase family protein [Paenibacillus alkalitolerans]|uniref:sugar phosphate isomerase/epimerase family protein n=1 Tax=Paenibacillus alkalitolerans TaxID=2799335 RepID=UPI0018F5A7D1|nr:TIM barrel protein [Paenibacillus alkalitolerans]